MNTKTSAYIRARKGLNLVVAASLLSTTAISTGAWAEEVTSTLDTVSVVATKSEQSTFDVPGMVDVIDTDAPSIAPASDTRDIFSNLAVVDVEGSGRRNGQNIVMRGYDKDAIIIQFDGIRQNFQSQHDGTFFIDPEMLKTVEVVRGASSALYGSGGLGGVIAFETKDAADFLEPGDNVGGTTALGFQDVNGEFLASGTFYVRSDTLDGVANLNLRRSGDIELADGNELNADDKVASGLAKLSWSPAANHTFSARVLGYQNQAVEPNNPQLGPGDDTSDQTADKNASSITTSLHYAFQSPDNPWLDLKAKIYSTSTEVEETVRVATSTNAVGDVLNRQLDTWGANIDNQSRFATGSWSHTLSYGLEYYEDEQNGSDSANGERGGVPDSEAQYFGAYIQDEILLGLGAAGELLVVPGVRFDQYESEDRTGLSNSDDAVSPKLGVTWMPMDWLRLFASYAEGFRAPNFTEVYTTGTHFTTGAGSNVFVANPSLRPETNETVEVGFGIDKRDLFANGDRVKLKAAYYDTDSKDFIEATIAFVPFPCCGTTSSTNVASASIKGWDAQAAYEFDRYLATIAYSVVEAKNDATGAYLINTTPDTFKVGLQAKLPEWDSVIGWRATIADEKNELPINPRTMALDSAYQRDGYVKHDLYYSWMPSRGFGQDLRFDFGIDNVFDKDYDPVFSEATAPGRNVKLKVSKRW